GARGAPPRPRGAGGGPLSRGRGAEGIPKALAPPLAEVADAEVAEAHLAAPVLQQDRPRLPELVVQGCHGGAVKLAVLDQGDSVEDHGDAARSLDLAVVAHPRSVKGDIVSVPLLRRPDRRRLFLLFPPGEGEA